jgi:hypothetical protein
VVLVLGNPECPFKNELLHLVVSSSNLLFF